MLIQAQRGQVLFYGQSLSVGVGSTAVSTSQPYTNTMLAGGVMGDGTPALPLVEAGVETPVSGCVNYLSERTSGAAYLGSSAGESGQSIEALSNGGFQYSSKLTSQINDGASVSGYPAAICWVQGEANSATNPLPNYYLGLLNTLAADIRADLNAAHGSSGDVPFITYQTSSRALWDEDIVLDQLSFATADAAGAISTPLYSLEFSDTLHLTAAGYLALGAYFAKAIVNLDVGNQAFIEPLAASADGTSLTVKFAVPVPPLVIDASSWQVNDQGFKVVDGAGTVGIDTVSASGSTVVLKLDRELSGAATVRYALDYTDGSLGQPRMGMGTVRDSDSAEYQGVRLANWMPHFKLSVVIEDEDDTINTVTGGNMTNRRIVNDYEMTDFFEVVAAANTSNNKKQYRAKGSAQPYAQGTPDTAATLTAKTGHAVDMGSTGFLSTNRATETGVVGVRNTDGTLGYHATQVGGFNTDDVDTIALTENGGLAYVADNLEDGSTIKLTDGKYNGHLLHVMNTGNSAVLLESTTSVIWGNDLRQADNTYTFSAGLDVISIRQREVVTLVWASQKWRVLHWDRVMYSGQSWKETTRGVEMRGLANIQALDEVLEVSLPVGLNGDINAFNTEVVMTDYIAGTWADGDVLPLADKVNVKNTFAWGVSATSPSASIAVVATSVDAASVAPLNASWMLRTNLGIAP